MNTPIRKVVKTRQLLSEVVPVSRAQLYILQKTKNFPKGFKIGSRDNAWFLDDVEAWLEQQAQAAKMAA